jgi:hypothetical protein
VALLTDDEGNKYTANGQVLTLVSSAPEAGNEPAAEPEVDPLDFPANDEGAEAYFTAVTTDDDPLGNPLTEGEQVATAEGVASGDPVPDDAAPTESGPWTV